MTRIGWSPGASARVPRGGILRTAHRAGNLQTDDDIAAVTPFDFERRFDRGV